jgi:hypothetical protein
MVKFGRQDHFWGPFSDVREVKIFGSVRAGHVVVIT